MHRRAEDKARKKEEEEEEKRKLGIVVPRFYRYRVTTLLTIFSLILSQSDIDKTRR